VTFTLTEMLLGALSTLVIAYVAYQIGRYLRTLSQVPDAELLGLTSKYEAPPPQNPGLTAQQVHELATALREQGAFGAGPVELPGTSPIGSVLGTGAQLVFRRSELRPPPGAVHLPVVEDPDKLCRTCEHFDLQEGQALASHHGPFMQAAAHIPPVQMGAKVSEEGEMEARNIPAAARWSEFGYCAHRDEGLWGKTDADRRQTMTDTGEPGGEPFLEVDVTDRLQQLVDCYEPKAAP